MPNMPNMNPADIQKYLGGIDFPVDKQTLIEHAEQRGADEQVLSALRELQGQRFNSPTDVSQALQM